MRFELISNLENFKGVELIFIDEDGFDKSVDKDELVKVGFKAKEESGVYLSHLNKLYVGVKFDDSEDLRIAAAKAYEIIKIAPCEELAVEVLPEFIEAVVEGFELSSYSLTKYKSKNEPVSLKTIYIVSNDEKALKKIEKAKTIACVTNYAKDIVNSIPNDYTPAKMAEDAKSLTKISNITCKVYDKEFMEKEGMGALLAVSKASIHEPYLIHLNYKPKNPIKKIVYIGKGLTYDSGGLSLKPSDYMVTMKADKSGAVAAMAIIKGAAKLNLAVEIDVILGATENMIGGDAYKPDDVLKSMSGTTIEVRNTDAEGRLVLADCLTFAQKIEADYYVDLATLTGACVVGVGEYTTGVMGHNDELKNQIESASKKSGELTNSLHFNRHLKKLLKSLIADISNISSSRYGGAITAGLFLDKFIEDKNKQKWIHLDIAGPAFVEKTWGYNGAGASGAGVRMNLYWLQELENKEA